ncbi:hypothetical protein PTQ53_03965 [Klebsiella michiganensis]|uniref:hypothetical protein n=1 Tax=Klebsiella michiganensis TaxID=1134687 RepID=UPI00287BCA8E|nr:hypothetical protein [Klebsiella michiganensis]MDS7758296.1 hypothetical protein [Klebsiella michiganensis]
MTDITELAQKPTRYGTNSQGVFTNQTDGAYVSYLDFVALVEELEKAQETIAFQQGEIKTLLSSLESRAVKLPPKIERNDIDGWFMYKGGRVGGGAAEWYNKALDDVGAELTAAGIKVEAG